MAHHRHGRPYFSSSVTSSIAALTCGFRSRPTQHTPLARRAAPLLRAVLGLTLSAPALAQLTVTPDRSFDQPAELVEINSPSTVTWQLRDDAGLTTGESAILLQQPVSIRIDDTLLTADSAVIWIKPEDGSVAARQLVEIALIGNATLQQGNIVREGQQLIVSTVSRGQIRITSASRVTLDSSQTLLYRAALRLRPAPDATSEQIRSALLQVPPTTQPKRELVTVDRGMPVRYSAQSTETVLTPDDITAVIMSGDVLLTRAERNGSFTVLRAQRAVLYTNAKVTSETDAQASPDQIGQAAQAVYLEGDVQIISASETLGPLNKVPEQRLKADRVFYEFESQRAVLTDAVLHTVEPEMQIPIIVRAKAMRQLASRELRAEDVELSTSSFAVPSYSIKARQMYIRQVESTDPDRPPTAFFEAQDTTLRALGLPFFYLPKTSGRVTEMPLRQFTFESSSKFGAGFRSTWGLYELLGQPKPKDVDVRFQADYLSDRGPAVGLDADYRGGFITDNTRDPWNFTGEVRSYLIRDGTPDDLGGVRRRVERSNELRGRFLWQHQHFFPEDWQAQIRIGYVSDPTFIDQYFKSSFDNDLPYESALYLKRQRDTEALTILFTSQINDFPTVSENVQEQFYVQRAPEVGYRRIGESILDDNFTFFSDNTASVLSFVRSDESLEDQGFTPNFEPGTPGLPSVGTTGTETDDLYRADLRQQIDAPITLGQFKVVPYVSARHTPYSDSIGGGSEHRLYGAVGTRIHTAFWKVDDSAKSELFDIHRIRHIVEPSANFYASGTTVDRSELFIYDSDVDGIYDVAAANLNLRQRFQTKRGGPGRWRNVDYFVWNVDATAFTNSPRDEDLPPSAFRGLFFTSAPEASIPRNYVNTDAIWRIADATAILAEVETNVDRSETATASIGIVVQRDPRLNYFLGTRYIEELSSNIATFAASYTITPKYTLGFSQSYNFSGDTNVNTNFSILRRFDRFFAIVSIYNDSVTDESGVSFSVSPEGFAETGPAGVGSLANSIFNGQN